MVNILPKAAQKKLHSLYYLRLFTMLMFLIGIVFLAGLGLLAPSYFLAQGEATAAGEYNTALQQTLALKQSKTVTGDLALLAEQLSFLKKYENAPSIAEAMTALTAHLPKGVTLAHILLAPPTDTDGKIMISGTAQTRAALLSYVSDLQTNTLFKGVSVPVSDLAGDSNLEFSISFYYNPKQK